MLMESNIFSVLLFSFFELWWGLIIVMSQLFRTVDAQICMTANREDRLKDPRSSTMDIRRLRNIFCPFYASFRTLRLGLCYGYMRQTEVVCLNLRSWYEYCRPLSSWTWDKSNLSLCHCSLLSRISRLTPLNCAACSMSEYEMQYKKSK